MQSTEYITTRKAIDILSPYMSRSTIYRLIKNGTIRSYRVTVKKQLLHKEDVIKLLPIAIEGAYV